eukprot:3058276-Prymnesium_polylepis.1
MAFAFAFHGSDSAWTAHMPTCPSTCTLDALSLSSSRYNATSLMRAAEPAIVLSLPSSLPRASEANWKPRRFSRARNGGSAGCCA